MGRKIIIKSCDFTSNAINGITTYKKIKDIFFFNALRKDAYIQISDGEESTNSGFGWNITDFMNIPSGSKFTLAYTNTYPTTAAIAFYNSDKQYISGGNSLYKTIAMDGSTSLGYMKTEIPSNASYMRISWSSLNMNKAKIETPSYEFYGVE